MARVKAARSVWNSRGLFRIRRRTRRGAFATLIRQRREALGLSLYELEQPGPKLFSSEAMRMIERGRRVPNFELMLRICWRLELPFGETMQEVDRRWSRDGR